MAEEQMPMEQEPSKSEPPETGAGYDGVDEVICRADVHRDGHYGGSRAARMPRSMLGKYFDGAASTRVEGGRVRC